MNEFYAVLVSIIGIVFALRVVGGWLFILLLVFITYLLLCVLFDYLLLNSLFFVRFSLAFFVVSTLLQNQIVSIIIIYFSSLILLDFILITFMVCSLFIKLFHLKIIRSFSSESTNIYNYELIRNIIHRMCIIKLS